MKYLILIVCLMLLVVGCEGDTGTSTTTNAFIGGTDSIEFNFIEGAPPPEVYDGGEFPFEVTLNVENKGEYDVDVNEIALHLVGFYPADFGVTDAQEHTIINVHPDENLDGAYIDSEGNVIPGTVTYVGFGPDGVLNYVDSLKGNNEFPIRAEACYKYGTIAQADLCILGDLTKTDGKVCQVSETKSVQSSSSPIQIENMQESVSGTNKITFSFEVVHRGTGAISRDSACSDSLTEKNKVKVAVSGIDAVGTLSCAGMDDSGYVTLYGGKRLIRCTLELPGERSDFEKKVYVDLEFYYEEHTETKVLVKHTVNSGTD